MLEYYSISPANRLMTHATHSIAINVLLIVIRDGKSQTTSAIDLFFKQLIV